MKTSLFLIFSGIVLTFSSLSYSNPLIRKTPKNLYRTAKTFDQAYRLIAEKNKWPLSLEDVEIDTVGSFEINGELVYAVNMYSLDNLNYEEFYLIYEKNGKAHYSFLCDSEQYRKRGLEHFELVTMANIYLLLHFREIHQDLDENTVSSKVFLYVVSFDTKNRGKFVTYNVPLRITNVDVANEYVVDVEIVFDSLIVFSQKSSAVHKSQKSLLGEHPLK